MWRFFSAGKGGNYVRNQIFIKGTRKVFLSDVSKMRKARQLLQLLNKIRRHETVIRKGGRFQMSQKCEFLADKMGLTVTFL